MYAETVDHFAAVAAKKSEYLRRSPGGFWISSMLAGAYVGLGIILIFSVGSDVDPAYRGLIMGASFGIALTLVIFAGSSLSATPCSCRSACCGGGSASPISARPGA